MMSKQKEMKYEFLSEPYLYILMRTDMASMNPGKAVAQGSHATNLFENAMKHGTRSDLQKQMFEHWKGDRGFGTAITLSVDGSQLQQKLLAAAQEGYVTGVCHDPTYPLRDGSVTHLIPLDTCGYVFGLKGELASILGDLSLMS
jgi:peptidyl-tRNA hydrolase